MASARETITTAARKLREVGRGEPIDAALATIGLAELNAMLSEFDEELFARYQDVHCAESMTVSRRYPAQRLVVKTGVTITLPAGTRREPIQDGFRVAIATAYSVTLARNGWLLEGAAADQSLSGTPSGVISRSYFFRADLGDWRRNTTLGLDDDLPYPDAYDTGIALLLAGRLSGELGQSLGPIDENNAHAAKRSLAARYSAPPDLDFDLGARYVGGATIWDESLPEETVS